MPAPLTRLKVCFSWLGTGNYNYYSVFETWTIYGASLCLLMPAVSLGAAGFDEFSEVQIAQTE